VLLALEEQEQFYSIKLPRNWTKMPTQEALKQNPFHLHPWAEDLPTLRQHILCFFCPMPLDDFLREQ